MVGISLKIFIKGEATGQPEVMNLRSVPKMFGICIYCKKLAVPKSFAND